MNLSVKEGLILLGARLMVGVGYRRSDFETILKRAEEVSRKRFCDGDAQGSADARRTTSQLREKISLRRK